MSFGVSDNQEETIHGDLFGFYWHIECWPLARLLPRCDNSFRFYWHNFGLWLSFWGNDWESGYKDPWWRKMYHLDFPDLLLGKAVYSNEKGERFEHVIIPMSEANYRATMTFETSTWKRPRWLPRVRQYTHIEVENNRAPEFPGKGENSWDCGNDSIWAMSTEGHSIPKAVGGYVAAVLENRLKRGGIKSLVGTTEPRRMFGAAVLFLVFFRLIALATFQASRVCASAVPDRAALPTMPRNEIPVTHRLLSVSTMIFTSWQYGNGHTPTAMPSGRCLT
jgi:hypothetical protein